MRRPTLTFTQRAVLDAVKDCIKNNGWAPTISELCVLMGYRSKRTAQLHLMMLEEKGYIRRGGGPAQIRLVGRP